MNDRWQKIIHMLMLQSNRLLSTFSPQLLSGKNIINKMQIFRHQTWFIVANIFMPVWCIAFVCFYFCCFVFIFITNLHLLFHRLNVVVSLLVCSFLFALVHHFLQMDLFILDFLCCHSNEIRVLQIWNAFTLHENCK